MIDDFGDTPPPPPPEFDPVAIYALASPELWKDERAEIIREARNLRARGLTREELCAWICRKVAERTGPRRGFNAYDADGNIIDPPHIAAARKRIRSQAGRKRQDKRNADLKQWRQRCEQMIEAGQPEAEVQEKCWVAINAVYLRSIGQLVPIPAGFEGLPIIYGLDGKSRPTKKRLRARLFD